MGDKEHAKEVAKKESEMRYSGMGDLEAPHSADAISDLGTRTTRS